VQVLYCRIPFPLHLLQLGPQFCIFGHQPCSLSDPRLVKRQVCQFGQFVFQSLVFGLERGNFRYFFSGIYHDLLKI